MVNHVLGKSTVPVVRLYDERLKNQIQFVNDSSCGAIIAHSSNVKCEQFHLGKSTRIENKCMHGYKREGSQYFTCEHVTSSCKLCNCNATGSKSNTCDEESGQCSCKDNFTGLHCEIKVHQDCKWSDWTGWSTCSRACGTGGEYKRHRHVAVKQQGSGKQCTGSSQETRQCFKKCCDGTFHCSDSSRCLTELNVSHVIVITKVQHQENVLGMVHVPVNHITAEGVVKVNYAQYISLDMVSKPKIP
ncbi:unnamed protein product [Mytilus edulis]|uniref:Laminin EGF-like domain-containing protein n=1 Tax=Mytilus edulis TaxID=6550 RepID=A0A8S3R4T8_MYTED|nr:unnamed protein product [Mytilus edulis]